MAARLPRRFVFPALAAVACAAVVTGVLWWQLRAARELAVQRPPSPLAAQVQSSQGASAAPAPTGYEADTGDQSLLHLRKGDALAAEGNWNEAAAEYGLSADAGGGLAALRKLAQAQLQRRDIDGARGTLERMKDAGARAEDVLLLESVILLRTGELTKAQEILQKSGDSPQKHYALTLLAIVQERHDDAQKEIALTAAGWEPVLRSYARTLLQAYDEYAVFPDSPAQHRTTLLARALAQVQECELALPMLSQVTQLQGDYRDAWVLQGYCELMTERTQESLASLERAYALDPEKPDIQYFLARAHAARGDHANALTFARYALENGFEPSAEVRRLIVREAVAQGNADLAMEQEDALTAAADATVETYGEYVSVALSADRKEDAVRRAQEAVTRWPQDARAYDLLGWATLESGRNEEAKQALDKALELNPQLVSARTRRERLQ